MHKKKRRVQKDVWIKHLKFLTYSSHTISTDTNQSRLLNVCVCGLNTCTVWMLCLFVWKTHFLSDQCRFSQRSWRQASVWHMRVCECVCQRVDMSVFLLLERLCFISPLSHSLLLTSTFFNILFIFLKSEVIGQVPQRWKLALGVDTVQYCNGCTVGRTVRLCHKSHI